MLPTLVELAKAKLPMGLTIDGRSIVDTLMGRSGSVVRREWIYSQLGKNRVLRDKRFKLWSDGRFYNTEADPLETKNLADSSDPETAAARKRLHDIMESTPEDAKLPWPPHKR